MTVPNRELSQFGSFVSVDDDSKLVSIGSSLYVSNNVGIGTSSVIIFEDKNIKIGDENTGKYTSYGRYNNFFGAYAGHYNTSGRCNNFFGCRAGEYNTTGSSNIALGGYYSLYCNTVGSYNISLGDYTFGPSSGCGNFLAGYSAGYSDGYGMNNSSYNNFIGWYAGGCYDQGNSYCNNFIGYFAGGCNTNSSNNNFFGSCSGYNNQGENNIFIGSCSGFSNNFGSYNLFFGRNAGSYTSNGFYNLVIGDNAGASNSLGSENVVIGYNSNIPIDYGSNQLVIGSGNTSWINGNSSYNVGIGTTNPTEKLDVNGNIKATAFYGDGSNITGISVANYWEKTSAGINTSAKVGFGTTNPSTQLQVFTSGATLFGGDKNATTTRYDDGTLNNIPGLQHSGVINQAVGANLFIYGNGASNNGLSINKSRGSLGSQGLVQKDDKIGPIIFNASDGVNFQTAAKISGEIDGTPSSGNMPGRISFYTTPSGSGVSTERVRIDSSGNVGVGTTNPTSRLSVVGNASISGVTTVGILSATTSASVVGILRVTGNAFITGVTTATDFNSTSDINLKYNINSISDPLSKLLQLNGVTFNWKKDDKPSVGIIAQEVEKVFPELVNGENPKTVNYNGLIGVLIEAIKEQQKEIENLKKYINK